MKYKLVIFEYLKLFSFIIFIFFSSNALADDNIKKIEKINIQIDSLKKEIAHEKEKMQLVIKQSDYTLDVSSKIIDWTSMILTIFVILFGIVGWIGTKRFREIDQTSKKMNILLSSMHEQYEETKNLGEKTKYTIEKLKKGFEADRKNLMTIFTRLREGELAYENGDMDIAINAYKKVLKINPNIPEANYMLGTSLSTKGFYLEAIKYLKKSIDLRGTDYKTYYNLGRAYRRHGNFRLAIENLIKAHEINPDFTYATEDLGHVYWESKEFNKALEWYEKTVRLDSNQAIGYVCIARISYYKGEIDKSIEYYNKAKEIIINLINYGTVRHWDYNQLGEIYLVLNNPKKADLYFKKSYVMNSTHGSLLSVAKVLKFLKSCDSPPDGTSSVLDFFSKKLISSSF